ncbi:MAG: nucleotidyltransferase domain-containing protein [Promethearchaeati archaeon SRVP18_Atabeyarchaeia-1]
MREKVVQIKDRHEVVYSDEDWILLKKIRQEASNLMRILGLNGIPSTVHGSVARGDVSPTSDIDIFIPMQVSSFKVELALRSSNIDFISRRIELATPQHAIKAHIDTDVNRTITFPLVNPKRREWEFYRFGGVIELHELMKDKRVLGVDKRLLLIEPEPNGHYESSIIGRERSVAKLLSVSLDLVEERVRVLRRRDSIGRTGVYLRRDLSPDESFEEVLKKISEKDPIIRRRLLEG